MALEQLVKLEAGQLKLAVEYQGSWGQLEQEWAKKPQETV
jgi:hypothetical protein